MVAWRLVALLNPGHGWQLPSGFAPAVSFTGTSCPSQPFLPAQLLLNLQNSDDREKEIQASVVSLSRCL